MLGNPSTGDISPSSPSGSCSSSWALCRGLRLLLAWHGALEIFQPGNSPLGHLQSRAEVAGMCLSSSSPSPPAEGGKTPTRELLPPRAPSPAILNKCKLKPSIGLVHSLPPCNWCYWIFMQHITPWAMSSTILLSNCISCHLCHI